MVGAGNVRERGADHCSSYNWFLGSPEKFLTTLLPIKVGGHTVVVPSKCTVKVFMMLLMSLDESCPRSLPCGLG